MSLNGLDAVEITEAYQSALGEGGGWYVSPTTRSNGSLTGAPKVSSQIYSAR